MRGRFNHLFRNSFNRGNHFYFKYSKLPKVNGVEIKGIWCPDEFCKDNVMLDSTYWNYTPYFNLKDYPQKANAVRALVPEFKELMGWQKIQGKKTFVRSVSFRTDSPTHGSSSIMTIYCGEHGLDVYHEDDVKWTTVEGSNEISYTDRLTTANEYVAKWLMLFERNFDITYPAKNSNAYWEPKYSNLKDYHGTYFETIGDLNYPSKQLETWKPHSCDPFVKNQYNENAYRFYDSNMHAHVFIEKVQKVEKGDHELIYVTFPSDHLYYLSVRRWTKDETMIRHTIETVHKDGSVSATMIYGNNVKDRKTREWAQNLYRIVKIQKI